MILKFYDTERNEQRYTECDSVSLVRIIRDQSVTSVNGFRTYQCNLYHIGDWLLGKSKITDTQFKKYFWSRLSKKLRHQIEDKILLTHPNHDLSNLFEIAYIIVVVDKLFIYTRFDVNDSDNEIEVN